MARPPKTGLDYFPFDTKPDMKLSSIIRKFGVSGLGTLIGLYQKIYDNGYYIKVDEDFIEDFCLEFGIDDEDFLKVFIKFSIRKKLFNENLYKTKKILTSTGIQKRFLEATKRRKCEHDVTFMLIDVDGNLVNVCNNEVNANISTQRKEKKSKGKESKEDRAKEFATLIFKIIKDKELSYSVEETDKFIDYWNETGDSDKKLRHEKEKTFGHTQRLSRWMKGAKQTQQPIRKTINQEGATKEYDKYLFDCKIRSKQPELNREDYIEYIGYELI